MRNTLKNIIPNWLKAALRKTKEGILNKFIYRTHASGGRNLVVTFHKCGSQWFRTVFSAPSMHQAIQYQFHTFKLLPLKGFDDRPLTARTIPTNLSPGIYGPLYMASEGVLNSLAGSDRVAVIIRDPRNVIVSWYESILKTHAKMGNISEMRVKMSAGDQAYGIDLMIEHADRFGTFKAMDSWITLIGKDPRVKIYRFEDIFSADQENVFKDMLAHFDLQFDGEKVSRSLAENSFSSLASKNQHYKQGSTRKWNQRLNEQQLALISSLCPKTIAYYDEWK